MPEHLAGFGFYRVNGDWDGLHDLLKWDCSKQVVTCGSDGSGDRCRCRGVESGSEDRMRGGGSKGGDAVDNGKGARL